MKNTARFRGAKALTVGMSILLASACASGSAGSDNEAGAGAGGGGGGECAEGDGPITVGHLNYYTGPFSDVGPFFEAAVDLAVENINENPPLDRELEVIHDDIGTVGEAQVARNFLQREDVDILLDPAHEYSSYREFARDYVAENDQPLMPSLHGGSIPADIGGTAEEPIFRGQAMDTAQAIAGVLQAREAGAETVAVVATQIAGSQLQKDAAVAAAEEIGLEVVQVIDVQPEQPNYRSTISTIASADPDALLLFSQAEDGGTMVKQAAEAGLSLTIIGSTEWLQEAFAQAATQSALDQHEAVWIAGLGTTDSPAWDAWQEMWESSDATEFADASNSYAYGYYDLLNVTALAIEAAGSVCASDWVEAMPEVTEGGTEVHTYEEGIQALRDGEDIDYNGVSGEYEYTDTGVVGSLFGVYEWAGDSLEQVTTVDESEVLELDTTVSQ
ncbi:ABC transporter substrate-binding protein [Blastococcus montanus]|uniref:ABC transporter substrate-binding protein n=1 Tax=Blastococcus montanus TaxID=3144973 RepID=UPI003208B3A5